MLDCTRSSIRRDAESIKMLFWQPRSFSYSGYCMQFWSPFHRVKREDIFGVCGECG